MKYPKETVGTNILQKGEKIMGDLTPIRVGMAGFGMSGRLFHAPFLHADPRFSLRRVYERTSERARKEYPAAEVVHSFEALLTEDIDLIVITTPNPLHVPMAEAALRRGKHVVVEKPMAASFKEAEALCRLAREQGVLLTVYQNRRLDGGFLTARRLIETGRLGEVVDYECRFDRFVQGYRSKQWKREGGRGVDLLYDIGVHLIDQAVSLFGLPEAVCGDLRRQRPESPGVDRFTVTLCYPERRVLLSAGELSAIEGPHLTVHGRRGSYVKYGRDVQEARLVQGLRPAGNPDWGREDPESYGVLRTVGEDGGFTEERVPTEAGNYGGFYDNLYRAIREGAPLLVRPEEAAAVLRILEAVQQSSREGRRIALAWQD